MPFFEVYDGEDEKYVVERAVAVFRQAAEIQQNPKLLAKVKAELKAQKESIDYALDDIRECIKEADDIEEPKDKLDKFMSRMSIVGRYE